MLRKTLHSALRQRCLRTPTSSWMNNILSSRSNHNTPFMMMEIKLYPDLLSQRSEWMTHHQFRSFHQSLRSEHDDTATLSSSNQQDLVDSNNDHHSTRDDVRFQEKQVRFRNALLSSVLRQRNRDVKFYYTLFAILGSVGSIGFEVLFRVLEMPYIGALYAASLFGYLLVQRTMALYSKGSFLAKSIGAVEIFENETCPEKLRVYQTVKEIANSIQLKMPAVCYIECEEPNAFACGYHVDCACVTVTSGLAKLLNDMELKSVLAHEIGHVINGDMKTGTLISAMIGAFTLGHKFARNITSKNRKNDTNNSRSQNKNAVQAENLILLLSMTTLIAGRIMELAISRHREYSADAIASAFTHPYHLRDALQKINNYHSTPKKHIEGGKESNKPTSLTELPRYESMAHLYIYNGLESPGSWISTHPSTAERLNSLESIASWNVEDFYKLTMGSSAMKDQRAKLSLFVVISAYLIIVVAVIAYNSEMLAPFTEQTLSHIRRDMSWLYKFVNENILQRNK
ncbi:hypothetical protein C9374_000933 [Naegleria lovaniensis]|uniref:Peptidase M48 domain-containing protein n=1 Tax=Naegleria lovaniensis TaxID=51637 RepID=A0AA88GXB0_NAELO|nr:uncharacterized protein C9374_000933 [Naegleria lovaniensis]KAG2388083.1 hypothetical protein C9374_000933 [Naegleria lovaniensis]